MTFYWPHAFWFLLIPLALAALELRRKRNGASEDHPKILRAEAGTHQLSLASAETREHHRARLRWRLWLGLMLAIIAFARPQWGRLEEPVFDQSREIIIALDLSRSMLAEDVRPSRLERAKLLVSSLLEQLSGERVGLIVFSGTAFLQSPLSADYEILREFLPTLNPAFLPEGGTDYTALLNTALTAYGATAGADRFMIVLSDGEATDETWKPLVADLKTKGIRVIGLGVGTTAGAMIPDGTGGFVKDERGAVVLSKLENSTLQQLANDTNGAYADASAWVDLAQLLESTVATGVKGEFRERNRVRLAERFQWALAPALLILLWSFWRDFPARPRLREVKLSAAAPASTATATTEPIRAPGVAPVAVLLLLCGAMALPTLAQDSAVAEPLSKLVGQFSARETLNARDYAELARTTISFGQRLQSAQRPVPEGPLHDALASVDAGSRLDRSAADWENLRGELNKLLQKKEPPPQEQPKQPPPQQSEQQQKQQNSPQQQNQQNQDQQQQQQEKQKQSEEQQQSSNEAENKEKAPPQNQSAFGDMKEKSAEKSEQPPPPSQPNETQKVGGSPERKPGAETKDPALAVPLQKLDQLRNQDSPVKLHQLLQGDKPTPKKKGKDW